jgi:pyruvate kinase
MMENLIEQLENLRADMLAAEQRYIRDIGGPHLNYADSQRNLLHYLVLRSHDLRPLQHQLALLGLSSLGRVESHVLASVDAVLAALRSLGQEVNGRMHQPQQFSDFETGPRLLESHSGDLLGSSPPRRAVRIMVTLPSEAGTDYTLIDSLVQQGMDVARINCAHDGPAVWERMIRYVRRAAAMQGRTCRILMDLAGPKLRTGPIEGGPAVVKVRPQRDALGAIVSPARVWITSERRPALPPTPADASVPASPDWISRLSRGDHIRFTDARDARREMIVRDVTPEGCWAEINKTAYLTPGMSLRRCNSKPADKDVAAIGEFPGAPGSIQLAAGDVLILTRRLEPGRGATRDSAGAVLSPARIACTLPEIFDDIQTGERVWFDDGRIGGMIEAVDPDRAFIRITQAKISGEKLRSDKGINLPDTALKLPALTDKDIEDLAFVAAHADMVGLSFVQRATDVESLLGTLKGLGRTDIGIVLKIETRRGFDQLPLILLAGMKNHSLGVMIARGDLAVECGFERLAEVQEEILWVSEAAHCPVIWATQVLETLAKDGIPSRAEITDAAMGNRAEAVMLNKGPHILKALQTLDDILQRMEAHQVKKQSMMRELHLASTFMNDLESPAPEKSVERAGSLAAL